MVCDVVMMRMRYSCMPTIELVMLTIDSNETHECQFLVEATQQRETQQRETTETIWFVGGTASQERHYSADNEQICRLFDRRNRFAGGMS